MLVKTIDDMWSETKSIKSFKGLLKFFNNSPVVCIDVIKWRQYYYVTVGTAWRNIFIQIDLSDKTVSFTARVDDTETKNRYKSLGTHDKRFNRAGVDGLIVWLDENT